jgi:subtilisin family serine protease
VGFLFTLAPVAQAATTVVGYDSEAHLRAAVDASGGHVVRTIPSLHVAEIETTSRPFGFSSALLDRAGIDFAQGVTGRTPAAEPALAPWTSSNAPFANAPFEWQWAATRANAVPASVLRAASGVTIAVVDTGADLSAPDLRAKVPGSYSVATGTPNVRDRNGHGTFVSALAAGSVTNGEGIAGFGGDARLTVIKASRDDGSLTDVDEANAIVFAVDHGARVINLSVGGPDTSFTERQSIQYAASHGVLVVAAMGNEYQLGSPVEYPAALLQPVGSNGRGGVGLAVAASTAAGTRAFFSNVGSHVSLAAPGENVFSALSSLSSPDEYPRSTLPGSVAGLYGYSSGTSFSTPEVAGAAALVMAANPFLPAHEVAAVLKETASGHGSWNAQLGFGVVDVAAAVARAQGPSGVLVRGSKAGGRVQLRWYSTAAAHYRISVRVDRKTPRLLLDNSTRTSLVLAVRHRHRYAFTVAALDANGAVAGTSTYSVRA